MAKPIALLVLLFLCVACGSTASPTAPASLPLELLIVEPGEAARIQLPPDPNATDSEANPQAFFEFVITGDRGQPQLASVFIDGELAKRDVTHFLLVMPDPLKPTRVRVAASGYQVWEIGLRLNLKHTRRFQVPVQLQTQAD